MCRAKVMIYRASSTGWQRPIGCLKLQVIFRKRATNHRALLRKMTYEDKASYDSTPPCSELSFENFCKCRASVCAGPKS